MKRIIGKELYSCIMRMGIEMPGNEMPYITPEREIEDYSNITLDGLFDLELLAELITKWFNE
jgi:hypothetical protein